MPEQFTQWPSGIRDTTEFPNISVDVETTFRDHLQAFCLLDGIGWNDYDKQGEIGNIQLSDQRLRTYRKMYERLGLIYRDNDIIRLSRLGIGIRDLEANTLAKRDEFIDQIRAEAVNVLSRYQLRNPIDGAGVPASCDVQPFFCILKAMYELDGKINYEEMNRVILRILTMADLDAAIQRIRTARNQYGNYANVSSSDLDSILGIPVHTDQPTARIAPWFSNAGWGGLIIAQQSDSEGYRCLVDESISHIERIISNPPSFYNTTDRDSWLTYYIGDAAVPGADSDTPANNESTFREWLKNYVRADGEHYSENTRGQYMNAIKSAAVHFQEEIAPYQTFFQIDSVDDCERAVERVRSSEQFNEVNRERGNGSLSACLELYKKFLIAREHGIVAQKPIRFDPGYTSNYARNRILFGAPGTGKSYTVNQEKDILLSDGGEYERVTFHPDYSYANFVGTYKPVPATDDEGNSVITYEYVPGPFMRTYVKALDNSRGDNPNPYLLIIEEINRANVAAVFGDVFQLLDRGDNEVSEYPIQPAEDVKKYLASKLGCKPSDYAELRLPDNMFIWATMNSADQGVFPMDTAFKRRWDFTYLGIDDSEAGIIGKKVVLGKGQYRRVIEWNELRKAINAELLSFKVNEDKLMGPYFLSRKIVPTEGQIDAEQFIRVFKNKVIMYLFDDAAKQKRSTLFAGCEEKSKNQYSKICSEFDTKGVYIFCSAISERFIDVEAEDDVE